MAPIQKTLKPSRMDRQRNDWPSKFKISVDIQKVKRKLSQI
jgi:hypothetical protein